MSFEDLLSKLGENSKEDSKEAVRLLIKIADAIINDPKNVKVRTLQKSNATISKKILQVKGGVLCLMLMGFQETSTSFFLPLEARLSNLHDAKDTLIMWKESVELSNSSTQTASSPSTEPSTSAGTSKKRPSIDLSKNKAWNQNDQNKVTVDRPRIKPIVLPPLRPLFKNMFLHQIELQFHKCLQYKDKEVLERAKKLIPLVTLESAAQKRLRTIQEHVKKLKKPEPDISLQDMLILELLQWFKEDFFTWVDTPDCSYCGGRTSFMKMADDKNLLVYTSRVEVHKCGSCQKFTTFPRYNDLNILLETRKGRCGEWANTFTLLCCAMGWDSRFVQDQTDHVWTEVYSIAQKRWLHCDPCENVCDKPLIYESGWGKKVSYVIAFSVDEVQDVTWRYTSHHKKVLGRRKFCSEQMLIDALMVLRKNRQEKFSECRRSYLTKRLALELVEFLSERKSSDAENRGRQSGDTSWRLARGEIQETSATAKYVWDIDENDVVGNVATVRYSAATDCYELVSGGKVLQRVKKWNMGSFEHDNIFRKEEKDWKQVYIARKEGESNGHISWKFNIKGNTKTLDFLLVNFLSTTYENGNVIAKLSSDDVCEIIPRGLKPLATNNFSGKRNITLTATLSGGQGDIAWQHAQLFRQPLDSDVFPFTIDFIFLSD